MWNGYIFCILHIALHKQDTFYPWDALLSNRNKNDVVVKTVCSFDIVSILFFVLQC